MKKANHKDTKIKKKDRKRAVSGYLETIAEQDREINALRDKNHRLRSELESMVSGYAEIKRLNQTLKDRALSFQRAAQSALEAGAISMNNIAIAEADKILIRERCSPYVESGSWGSDVTTTKEGGQ